jgi:hypothetical protein
MRIYIMTDLEAAKWKSGHSALVWLERSSRAWAERTIALFPDQNLVIVTDDDSGCAPTDPGV